MQKREIADKVSAFDASLVAAETKRKNAKQALSSIQSQIWSLSEEISGLFDDKRAARGRDWKAAIQEVINEKLSERSRLHSDKLDAEVGLRKATQEVKEARHRGRHLLGKLNEELKALKRNKPIIDSVKRNRFAQNLTSIKSTLQESFSSIDRAIAQVRARLQISDEARDYQFEAVDPAYFPSQGVSGLRYSEPVIRDAYLTSDGCHAVPLEEHSVLDSLDSLSQPLHELVESGALVGSDAAYKIGEIAVEFVCAVLETKGHTAIWKAGGSGQPDILSLDQQGNIWVTESKGTMSSRGLGASGLERILSEKLKLMENSPDWLARNLVSTLGALNRKIDTEIDSKEQRKLIELRSAYLEAAQNNFCGGNFRSQVAQVGMDVSQDLKPPYSSSSKLFERWVEATKPHNILQIELCDSRIASHLAGDES